MKTFMRLVTQYQFWRLAAGLLWLAGTERLAAAPSGHTAEGYALPQPGREFVFPRDHGSHPDFAIE